MIFTHSNFYRTESGQKAFVVSEEKNGDLFGIVYRDNLIPFPVFWSNEGINRVSKDFNLIGNWEEHYGQ